MTPEQGGEKKIEEEVPKATEENIVLLASSFFLVLPAFRIPNSNLYQPTFPR
jgi:hypothetical protein